MLSRAMLFVSVVHFVTSVSSAEPTTTPPGEEPATQKSVKEAVSEVLSGSRAYRGASTFVVNGAYSPLDLIIPNKFGGSVGWIASPEITTEFEYLTAKIAAPGLISDLGEVSEQRASLLVRSFGKRETFHFHYGISYFDVGMRVGSELLARATGAPDIELIKIQALGFTWGIGNRWTLAQNFTLGVDWLAWEQPVYILKKENGISQYLSRQEDKDIIDTAIKVASYLPRFTLLKLQLGYAF